MLDNQKFIQILLKYEGIKFSFQELFQYSSGISSPVYCDNRILLGIPEIRLLITETLSHIIKNYRNEATLREFNFWSFLSKTESTTQTMPDVIVGTATAGIPWATLVADSLGLPLSYVRASKKEHGTKSQFEGANPHHKTVLVVDDVFSTGGSVLAAVQRCREQGAYVLGVVTLFHYDFKFSKELLEKKSCSCVSIGSFAQLLRVSLEIAKKINREDGKKLLTWHEQMSQRVVT